MQAHAAIFQGKSTDFETKLERTKPHFYFNGKDIYRDVEWNYDDEE